MTGITVAIVVAGVLATALLGLAVGFDATAVVIFAILVGLGVLAIAVARKASSGAVAPARCPDCGGLISGNAPYCKHCGARTA